MSKRCSILAAAVLVLAALPATAQDWTGRGRASGLVVNVAGEPVAGAKVTLTMLPGGTGPEPVETNDKGRWALGGLAGGQWKVVIEAPGYKISEGTLPVNPFGRNAPLKIELVANPYAAIDAGDAEYEKGNYAAARAAYQKAAVGLEPAPAARLRARIGDTYFQENDLESARAEYRAALPHIAPAEQTHILLQLANSYQKEEKYAQAREEYQKALPLLTPEGQAQVMLSIARGYDLGDNRGAAIETLEQALEVSPKNAQLLQLIADLLTRAGREEEARAYLDRLPEDAELPTDMVLNIGIRLYNEGKADEALEYFDRAVREKPELAESYYYRGLVRLNRNNTDGARADFQKLLELEPENDHADEVKEFLSFLGPGG